MSNSALNKEFLDGCQARELRLQKCASCQHVQFYPRVACSQCAGAKLDWVNAKGGAKVSSFTVVRQAISPNFKGLLPYVAVIVELDEGPTMMSVIVDAEAEAVEIGAKVVLEFRSWGGEHLRPVFRLAGMGD